MRFDTTLLLRQAGLRRHRAQGRGVRRQLVQRDRRVDQARRARAARVRVDDDRHGLRRRGERDAADHRRAPGLRPPARLRGQAGTPVRGPARRARRRAPPPQPRSRGLYLGTSSYEVVDRLQAPVVMRASKDARKVAARWTIAAKCRRGPRELFVNLTPPTRVARRRRVRAQRALRRPLRGRARPLPHALRRPLRGRGRERHAAPARPRLQPQRQAAAHALRLRHAHVERRLRRHRHAPRHPARRPAAAHATGEPRQPVVGAWSLRMTSDAGDYIGQGQSWTHGPSTDTLRVWGSPTLVRLYLTNAEGWWDGNVAAPPGAAADRRHHLRERAPLPVQRRLAGVRPRRLRPRLQREHQ